MEEVLEDYNMDYTMLFNFVFYIMLNYLSNRLKHYEELAIMSYFSSNTNLIHLFLI